MQAESAEIDDTLRLETDDLAMARSDLERSTARKEQLGEEISTLERTRNRLDENIARLERVREEYLSEVRRAKTTMTELTKDSDSEEKPKDKPKDKPAS